MKRTAISVLTLLVLNLAAIAVLAEDSAPTSQSAKASIAKFEEAKGRATSLVTDFEATARKRYLLDLQKPLDAAFGAANLKQSSWIKAEMDRVKGGERPVSDKPPVDSVVSAWTRYQRAIDKPLAEARRQLDAAKKQAITELETAKHFALTNLRDVDEANRIDSEIRRIRAADLSSAFASSVNLISLLDSDPAALSAGWKRSKEGQLVGERPGNGNLKIEFPFQPPEEYDYTVVFIINSANPDYIAQISIAGRHQFLWTMAGRYNKEFMFERIRDAGKRKPDALPVSVNPLPKLVTGRRHEAMIRVRKNGIAGYVDGVRICEWTNEFDAQSLELPKAMAHPDRLGVESTNKSLTVVSATCVKSSTSIGQKPPAPKAATAADPR